MTDSLVLDIDVSDLCADQAAAWFHQTGYRADSGPQAAGLVTHSDDWRPVGRWLGLRANRSGGCCGAIAARIHRDGTADVSAPECYGQFDSHVATALLEQASARLADRGVQLAVVYLPILAESLHACAQSAQFRRAGELLVLCRSVDAQERLRPLAGWSLEPCVFGQRDDLPDIFERTLIGSRDFPDLPQISSIPSILERFAEVGYGDTPMWYLIRYGKNLAGCLLMAAREDCQMTELQYVGLAPEYRGRGGGRIVLQHALSSVGRRGVSTVTAGVDAENDPAIAIYASAGFDPASGRMVFFRRLATDRDVGGVRKKGASLPGAKAAEVRIPAEDA